MEEHLLCKQGVVGSSPIISTVPACLRRKQPIVSQRPSTPRRGLFVELVDPLARVVPRCPRGQKVLARWL